MLEIQRVYKQKVYLVITSRFIPGCTSEALAGLRKLAYKYDAHVQTHCSESDWAHQFVKDKYGMNNAQALDSFGYTYDFSEFCLKNGLASEVHGNILLNPELGNIYMTILSNAISETNHIECITDNSNMQKYNIFSRYSNFTTYKSSNSGLERSKINIAQSEIKLALPTKLDEIDINTIIELRNSSGFKEKLMAFHTELDRYLNCLENNEYDSTFIEYLDRSKLDLFSEFSQLTPNLFSFGVGVWFAINAQIDYKDLIGTFLVGGAITASVAKIHKIRVENYEARFTRKYLSTLRRIPV